MSNVTNQQILNLVLDVQQQMHQGFSNVDVKLLSLEQRLTFRIDGLEERMNDLELEMKNLRISVQEDVSALNSVLTNHERRITKLERKPF